MLLGWNSMQQGQQRLRGNFKLGVENLRVPHPLDETLVLSVYL